MKDMSATVLEAQDAEHKAKQTILGVREALQAAESNKDRAEAKASAAAEKIKTLELQIEKLVSIFPMRLFLPPLPTAASCPK